MKQQAIDGALGFVISTFARPEDILIDMRRLSANGIALKHGDEGEIILKPGTYTARIVKKYTVKGEVDPEAVESHDNEELNKAIEAADDFVKTMKVPSDLGDLTKINDSNFKIIRAAQIAQDIPKFRKLVLDSTTTQVIHEFDKLLDFYKKNLHNLENDDLSADNLISNQDVKKRADSLKKFLNILRRDVRHSKFANSDTSKSKGKIHELTAEEFRSTINPADLKPLETDLLVKGRIVEKSNIKTIDFLASAAGLKLPSTHFHMLSVAKQQSFLNEVFFKFLEKLGLEPSNDYKENVTRVLNLLKKAYRNYVMIDIIQTAEKALKGNGDEYW
jgi:hypothetical protein